MITKEQILTRYSELRKALEEATTRVVLVQGALGDCEYWLKQEEEALGNPDLREHRNAGDESPADSNQ